MSFTEDLSVFFDTGEFADTGLYNGSVSVNGIVDDEYADVFQGDGAGVSTTRQVFVYDAADITSPTVGVTFAVNSVDYIVRDIEISNKLGKLILEKV